MTRERQGELAIFSEASLWALFPIVTILSFNSLPPFLSLGGSLVFATIFFAFLVTVRRKWAEVWQRQTLRETLIFTLINGVIYTGLIYVALQYTSAGNVSLVSLSEVFFSYLFFHVWKKDQLPLMHLVGSVLIMIGVALVFVPTFHQFQAGDLLVLLASALSPIGNYLGRRAREQVSTESIFFIRSFVSAAIILPLGLVLAPHFHLANLMETMSYLAINGMLMLGLSKILWVEGIHRISVVKANALSSISPLMTLFFAWLLLHNPPNLWQLLAFGPMGVGVFLLNGNGRPRSKKVVQFTS